MLIFIYFVLGLAAGSFANALAWRLYTHKNWLSGRSQCPTCGHQLAAADLVPIISYLSLLGRCRYCKKSISPIYLVAEVISGLAFAASYYFWPNSFNDGAEKILFGGWLVCLTLLIVLAIYDWRWRILPSRAIYSALVVAATVRLIYVLNAESSIAHALLDWALAVAVASGIFWLIFMVSKGKWIGYGDVRLGLVTGTLLATPAKSFLMIFIASLVGVVFSLPGYINGQNRRKELPYGPYLILATLVVMLFGASLISHYKAWIS